MNKQTLRSQILKQRKQLSQESVQMLSARIINDILQMDLWSQAETVCLYVPVNNEVNVRPLFRDLWEQKKRVLLPRCRDCAPGSMLWAELHSEKDLIPGPFDIPEPADSCSIEAECCPDIIVVPAVGVDKQGHRIGYGKGYYDRFLSALPDKNSFVLAPVYSFQVVTAFATDPWDVPVDCILTEEETIWTSTA